MQLAVDRIQGRYCAVIRPGVREAAFPGGAVTGKALFLVKIGAVFGASYYERGPPDRTFRCLFSRRYLRGTDAFSRNSGLLILSLLYNRPAFASRRRCRRRCFGLETYQIGDKVAELFLTDIGKRRHDRIRVVRLRI